MSNETTEDWENALLKMHEQYEANRSEFNKLLQKYLEETCDLASHEKLQNQYVPKLVELCNKQEISDVLEALRCHTTSVSCFHEILNHLTGANINSSEPECTLAMQGYDWRSIELLSAWIAYGIENGYIEDKLVVC